MILDIEKYPEFVPWCLSGKIHRKDDRPDMIEMEACLLYTSPSPRDGLLSRMPSSA